MFFLVKHSIFIYWQILSEGLLIIGSFLFSVWFSRHFEEVYKRVWFDIIWWNTAYWFFRRFLAGKLMSVDRRFIGDFCQDIWVSAVCSRKFTLIGILKKFINGFGFCYLVEHSIFVYWWSLSAYLSHGSLL